MRVLSKGILDAIQVLNPQRLLIEWEVMKKMGFNPENGNAPKFCLQAKTERGLEQ
jgi:hypothetical protein